MTTGPLADLLERAIAAEDALEERGATIEDDWQYVTDLAGAWRGRLEAVRAARADEAVSPAVAEAVDEAMAEAALIEDPHRAIDWLSTFPQIVLAALGEGT